MANDTVAIHHTKHPEAWNRSKLALDAVTVLVDLAHLRNKSSSRLHSDLLHNLRHEHLWTTSVCELANFFFLRAALGVLGRSLPPNVDSCEVCAMLQGLGSTWIYLN